jgi:hypothetical protein
MRTWILVVVGALLVAAVPTTALLLASHESTQTSASQVSPSHGHGHAFGHGQGLGRHKGVGPRRGGGPFGAPGPGMRPQLRHHLMQQWQDLTPAQRAQKLAALARQRASALQAWADCLTKSKTPASCRPPGLAKRG